MQAWRFFEPLSGSQPSAWFWAWSRDPPRFTRRHPPHHLSPAWAKHPAGTDLSASRVLLWLEGSRDPTYVTGPWRPAPFSHRNDRCEPDNRRGGVARGLGSRDPGTNSNRPAAGPCRTDAPID